jgi:iron complex outermembrane receptor protein
MFKPRIGLPMVCLALVVLLAAPVVAQTQTGQAGRIVGTVRDTIGTAVGGAPITIKNEETGATRVVRASPAGKYEASDLQPGVYTVSAYLQGFEKVAQKGRRLDAGATLTVDFTLELTATEDVTVTAMKREETVFRVPVSVTAVTEDTLQERGVDNIEGVANNVANFSVQNLGPGQSTVAIRGVSSGQIARDQPGVKEEVGVYLDDSTISLSLFTPDMDLFDSNRVEVLRGPQGTLFGAGNVGGTVRYITNQPQLGLNAAFGEVTGNVLQGGGEGGSFKAGFNAALGSAAAMRMAAYYTRFAGYIDAVQPDGSVNENVNAADRVGMRLAFDIAPVEGLTIVPRFVYQKVSAEGWNRVDNFNILANPYTTTRPPVTLGPTQQYTQIPEPYSDTFTLGDLNVKYEFCDVLLASITSFVKRNILVTRDAGALTSSVTGGSIGLPEDVYTLNSPLYDATSENGWTEELRASGATDHFNWVAGFFYQDTTRRYAQNLVVNEFTLLSGIPTRGVYAPTDYLYYSRIQYKLRQYGLFGEGTYAFTNQLSATVGLRYYNYSEDKTLVFDGLFAPEFPNPTYGPGNTKADGVAPRFIVSYKPSDTTTINAQASKGFRLGGFNDPILAPLCSPSDLTTFGGATNWQDETTWNYELGSKSKLFGGRGSLNASAFYEDISNLQVVVTAGTCSSRLVYNAPKARSVGGELEFGMAPSDHFDFSIGAGYANSQVTQTLSGSEATIEATGIRDGNRLPSVPKFQLTVAATYQQPIGRNYFGYINGTYQFIDSRYTQLADQEPGTGTINMNSFGANTIGGPLTQSTFTFNPLLPSYSLLNMRLGVRHDVWDFSFYVNNVTNELALLALDRERGFRARQGFLVNPPRTYGLTARVDF